MSIDYKAYELQENFRLILKTEIDFDVYNPTAQVIEYIKPDGTPGNYTATVLVGSESDGKICCHGQWRLRTKLTIAGKIVYTDPVDWYVGEFA